MSYKLPHIQLTAQIIASKCLYTNGKTLPKSQQRILARDLTFYISNLSRDNPSCIVLDPQNGKLNALWSLLEESGIQFPQNKTFLLKRNGGLSFEKTSISKLSLDEQIDLIVAKVVEDLEQWNRNFNRHAKALEASLKAILKELKKLYPLEIKLEPENKSFASFFKLLEKKGLQFPPEVSYVMKRHGECLIVKNGEETILHQPLVQREQIFEWAQYKQEKKNKGKKRRGEPDLASTIEEVSHKLTHLKLDEGVVSPRAESTKGYFVGFVSNIRKEASENTGYNLKSPENRPKRH